MQANKDSSHIVLLRHALWLVTSQKKRPAMTHHQMAESYSCQAKAVSNISGSILPQEKYLK